MLKVGDRVLLLNIPCWENSLKYPVSGVLSEISTISKLAEIDYQDAFYGVSFVTGFESYVGDLWWVRIQDIAQDPNDILKGLLEL